MKASGLITTCTASEFTPGKMAVSTKENIKMIRSTDSASTRGLMADATAAIGAEVNSMV